MQSTHFIQSYRIFWKWRQLESVSNSPTPVTYRDLPLLLEAVAIFKIPQLQVEIDSWRVECVYVFMCIHSDVWSLLSVFMCVSEQEGVRRDRKKREREFRKIIQSVTNCWVIVISPVSFQGQFGLNQRTRPLLQYKVVSKNISSLTFRKHPLLFRFGNLCGYPMLDFSSIGMSQYSVHDLYYPHVCCVLVKE